MPTIHIALQDGFFNDDVAILVGGKEVLRASQVKTRMQIGLAKSAEAEIPGGKIKIAVDVPSRGSNTLIDLNVEKDIYVGISLAADGQISHHVSTEPFRYA